MEEKIMSGDKSNVALMALVFDFLNQLDQEQLNDLLEGRVKLKLHTSEDDKLEAIVSELVNKKFEALKNEMSLPASVSLPREVKAREKKPINRRTKGRGKAIKAKMVVISPETEAKINTLKTFKSRDEIVEFLSGANLKRGGVQVIATSLGVTDTRKMTREELQDSIARILIK